MKKSWDELARRYDKQGFVKSSPISLEKYCPQFL